MKYVSDELYSNLERYMSKEELGNYIKNDDTVDSPHIIEYIREYYNKRLPVDVIAWRQVNHFLNRDDEIDEQIKFMIEQIVGAFFYDTNEQIVQRRLMILGTHLAMSDAIFPIFQFNTGDAYDGLEIVASCIGEEWYASFKLDKPLKDFDHMYFFNPSIEYEAAISHLGKNNIYSSFNKSQKEFTTKFNSMFDFYAFCMLVKKHLEY